MARARAVRVVEIFGAGLMTKSKFDDFAYRRRTLYQSLPLGHGGRRRCTFKVAIITGGRISSIGDEQIGVNVEDVLVSKEY